VEHAISKEKNCRTEGTEGKRKGSVNDVSVKPRSADLVRGASTGEWFLSRRDTTVVARHEVPG
jgi:hypothetical protein